MLIKNKIALDIPNSDSPDRYFSFPLKQTLRNELSEYKQPSKIVVIADIEGEFQSLCKLLYKSGVIDKYLRWKFNDGHLVLVGDCFDRGELVIECLWLIYSLEERANREGGHVHFILGNHEIMNLNGDWRYVHPKYAVMSANSNKPSIALYDGNNELWRWLCTKNIIEKIGDLLFVHGGISNELLKLNLSVKEINALARPYYTYANDLFINPALNTVFSKEHAPFWYRGYYQDTVKEEQIDNTLTHFGVKTIVTGHTVVDKITPFFNGKVINVDTAHAAGHSEALLIVKNRFYRIFTKGDKERIHLPKI